MKTGYTDEELDKLHRCLYDILRETVRVCNEINVKFFMVGGSMIGCHFWDAIVPIDDDVDVGMPRSDYERFLKEAPSRLRDGYILQWFGNTPETPFYFAKVRKTGTLFVEETTRNLDMPQGIYVDIFPFDHIPDDIKKQRRQRKLANTINSCFVSKSVWTYKYCGKCEIAVPNKHGFLNCLFDRVVNMFVPKRILYVLLKRVQTRYNDKETVYCSNVMTDMDQVRVEYVNDLQPAKFGDIDVFLPKNYEEYLHHHYPNLRKHLPKEEAEKYSHRPVKLSFGDEAHASEA